MLNKKGLNSAGLETVRVSRTSTTVITANKEMRTNERTTIHVKDLDLFVTNSPRIRRQFYRLENSAKIMFFFVSGQVVKKHKKTDKYNATQKTKCLSFFKACPLDLPAPAPVRVLHRHRRTHCEMILGQVQQTHEIRANVTEHWETSCEIRVKPNQKYKQG